MEYTLSDNTWGHEEKEALRRVIDSGMFTMGKEVKAFETSFAEKLNVKHAVMVNSGSSANLLAVAALVYSGMLNMGDEVIVPAVSWSTTYFSLHQMGLKLRFVDIDRDTLNIDTDQLEKAITPNTKMIFAVNLLGNPNDFTKISAICEKKGIFFIEDNCESLGAAYKGKNLGTIGLLGTFSMFYSHHICTMEGGVVATDHDDLYDFMLAIRAHGWTRELPPESRVYKKRNDRFFEKFNFIVPGFNLRPLEMEGALGVEQLKKLDRIVETRRKNAAYLRARLDGTEGVRLQRETEKSSWFGFSILLEGEFANTRDLLARRLTDANIEVRPIVAGNFINNKACAYLNYSIYGDLTNAQEIHENGFFIGNHSQPMNGELDYFCDVLHSFLKEKQR